MQLAVRRAAGPLPEGHRGDMDFTDSSGPGPGSPTVIVIKVWASRPGRGARLSLTLVPNSGTGATGAASEMSSMAGTLGQHSVRTGLNRSLCRGSSPRPPTPFRLWRSHELIGVGQHQRRDGGVPRDLRGNTAGEVVRQASDDDRDGGNVLGRRTRTRARPAAPGTISGDYALKSRTASCMARLT